ncbi:MAG: chemotaxis-specific protein-glutamate methyltransferase CheB [Sulfuriflexus sp.]|nr:chemotaxis-specific protein-glutamate methyltransferase CheB [Sulfuriflexus sp.]
MRIAIANDNDTNLTILKHAIENLTNYDIAWTAIDGSDAINKCKNDTPDLILMDMIMPNTNGVEASRIIMKETPCAILIVTASVSDNAAMIFEAMSYGALDVVQTPFSGVKTSKTEIATFLKKIKVINSLVDSDSEKKSTSSSATNKKNDRTSDKIVVLGASTGGPGVLATILSMLPADFPAPIIIVQHVDSSFTENFAHWLDKQSKLKVRIAEKNVLPKAGLVLVAGKSEHLVMNENKHLAYSEKFKELVYKPSVNVFFESIAKNWKGQIVAGLLTGMGKDGAQGLADIHEVGGHTITQTKETCAVYGMPKAADEMGVSLESLDPEKIADSIINIICGEE